MPPPKVWDQAVPDKTMGTKKRRFAHKYPIKIPRLAHEVLMITKILSQVGLFLKIRVNHMVVQRGSCIIKAKRNVLLL